MYTVLSVLSWIGLSLFSVNCSLPPPPPPPSLLLQVLHIIITVFTRISCSYKCIFVVPVRQVEDKKSSTTTKHSLSPPSTPTSPFRNIHANLLSSSISLSLISRAPRILPYIVCLHPPVCPLLPILLTTLLHRTLLHCVTCLAPQTSVVRRGAGRPLLRHLVSAPLRTSSLPPSGPRLCPPPAPRLCPPPSPTRQTLQPTSLIMEQCSGWLQGGSVGRLAIRLAKDCVFGADVMATGKLSDEGMVFIKNTIR